MSLEIRHAAESDIQPLTDIYNHYIEDGAITFDTEPKSIPERLAWLSQFDQSGPHQLFVATDGGAIVGYAGSSRFRERAAYSTSVETTIYLHPKVKRKGAGTLLYQALFSAIEPLDLNRAYAGISLPNEASIALHKKFGFKSIGIYSEVGRKFGQFWDVQWFEKSLNLSESSR